MRDMGAKGSGEKFETAATGVGWPSIERLAALEVTLDQLKSATWTVVNDVKISTSLNQDLDVIIQRGIARSYYDGSCPQEVLYITISRGKDVLFSGGYEEDSYSKQPADNQQMHEALSTIYWTNKTD